jgi:SAM-dependent methyltransferase
MQSSAQTLSTTLQKVPPVLLALLCHLLAIAIMLLVGLASQTQGWAWAVAEGVLAATFAWLIGLPVWWLAINVLFAPLALWARQFNLDSLWFLGAFLLLASLFWTTFSSRVPLFLTNASTRARLAQLLPPGARVLDLGCGFGGLLHKLAGARADCAFHGCEIAPLPAVLARLRTCAQRRVSVTMGDFWQMDFADYEVVYAFLSPVPMPALWDKARREMRAGSLLISNTFTIPGVAADEVIALNDYRHSALHVWRM